jgi:signal transduction histidine kinase
MEACLHRAVLVHPLDAARWPAQHSRMRLRQRVIAAAGIAGLLAGLAYPLVGPSAFRVAGSLAWIGLVVIPTFAVAIWLVRRRPDHPQAHRLVLLASANAVSTGLEGPLRHAFLSAEPPDWLPWLNLAIQYVNLLASIAGSMLIATYPDGTVERPWQRRVVGALWLQLALPPLLLVSNPVLVADLYLLEPRSTVPNPFAVGWLTWLGPPAQVLYVGYYGVLVALAVLVARFMQAEPTQRRRMRPLLYATIGAVALLLATNALYGLGVPGDAPVARIVGVLSIPGMLMVPLAIVVGVVRHRLFDIDLAVRRSVVYGALVLAISAAYIALTAAPGLAIGSSVPVELAVGLTVLAAVAFQPLRRRVEALADRWVFGAKVDRYRLLTDFGAGLEQTVELSQLLPRLADTVRRGLDASWVRVSVRETSAAAGEVGGSAALSVPLERGGDGVIECGPKPGGYDEGDRELLATLAGQAATAIANVRLTAQLAERLADLTASRARIVAAADDERRRIERNLHDGVQQHVVALITKIRLTRNALERGRAVDAELAEVQADAAELLVDLRELAHGIHPPVLSDRGLVEAIETRADRMPLPVATRADPALRDRRFAPDLEAAAYYVVCEALTNVVKHAGARTAAVELSAANGHLTIAVRDDGCGVAEPDPGQGLTNLRDRVEAIGGRLHVDGRPGSGLHLLAELPAGGAHG